MALSTTYRSTSSTIETGPKKFDAQSYGKKTYASKVVPAIEERAVELSVLAPLLQDDPQAAGAKYGRRAGTSPYAFPVKGQGIAGKPVSNLLPVKVEGLPEGTTVNIQIGPAVNGTSLRDAVGFIKFGQFTNQVEFADVATALNREMRAAVLDPLDRTTLAGKSIAFTGAFTFLTPTLFTITPVQLEVSP